MAGRAHRFLQYLYTARQAGWFEVPALDGQSAQETRKIPWVRIDAPGGTTRAVKGGIRLIIKQAVRLIYLSPLLIIPKVLLEALDSPAADWLTVAFVLFVCVFFGLLNLYVIWSVIEHFTSRGRWTVAPPFSGDDPDAFGRGLGSSAGRQVLRQRGVVARVADPLPGSTEVIRDLWTFAGEAPWRMTEATDMAMVAEGQRPVIVRFTSAPMLIGPAAEVTVGQGLGRMSSGLGAVFDTSTATVGEGASLPASFLSLSEGDEVEIVGVVTGEIANVRHFELAGHTRGLEAASGQSFDPYRGISGEPGTLIVADESSPVWLRAV